jgi:hypothetical protein
LNTAATGIPGPRGGHGENGEGAFLSAYAARLVVEEIFIGAGAADVLLPTARRARLPLKLTVSSVTKRQKRLFRSPRISDSVRK